MEENLGRLKTVNVRKVWTNESSEFTPWLAREDNIALLGKALGIELEVENIEVSVGPYSADILAKDSGTGQYVVIENQLGKTDHDHLGKAITYASVLNASAVIWIATDFTEEHQKALTWLNDNTSEELAFYGVNLEVWQVDDSRPAVKFNVVSRPAAIVRQAAIIKASGQLTETKKLQMEYWSEFRKRLLSEKIVPSAQSPRPQYWFDISLGRSGIWISNTADTFSNKIGVRVYLASKVADQALKQLLPQKEEIEKEIGESLQWNPFPDKRDKIIIVYRDADLKIRVNWSDYLAWQVKMAGKFRKAFVPRVKKLKLDASKGLESTFEKSE